MHWHWRLAASLAALALAPWAATALDASAAARLEAQTLSRAAIGDEARPRPAPGETRIGFGRRAGGRVLAVSDLAEPAPALVGARVYGPGRSVIGVIHRVETDASGRAARLVAFTTNNPRSPRAVYIPAETAALDARSRIVLTTMSRGSLGL